VNLVRYTPEQWSSVAEAIHSEVFNEFRGKEINRIDYVLVVWHDSIPLGYMTLRESDSASIYIGYGGILPEARKNIRSYGGYMMLLAYLKQRYDRATTLIENTNIEMLRLAFKAGFIVTGLKAFKEYIFLELTLEWGEHGSK
jgi:hypothetical protein